MQPANSRSSSSESRRISRKEQEIIGATRGEKTLQTSMYSGGNGSAKGRRARRHSGPLGHYIVQRSPGPRFTVAHFVGQSRGGARMHSCGLSRCVAELSARPQIKRAIGRPGGPRARGNKKKRVRGWAEFQGETRLASTLCLPLAPLALSHTSSQLRAQHLHKSRVYMAT